MERGTAADAMRDPELLAACAELQSKAVAKRTLDIYDGELQRLDDWLGDVPLTDGSLALYLCALHREGKSASTIGTVVAATRFHAKNKGLPSAVGAQATKTASGIRREAAAKGGQRQADAIGWDQTDRMARTAERSGRLGGVRDAALIAVRSDTLLRVSEMWALDVEDVSFIDHGRRGAEVTVRRSKTDQKGAGRVLYCGPPTARRLKRWMEAAGVAHGPLFRRVLKNAAVQEGRLSTRSLQNVVKRWAYEAGVSPQPGSARDVPLAGKEGRITWHSLRIGSAQELAARHASLVEMQHVGRWKSPTMPAHYVRGELAAEGAMARLRYGRTPAPARAHGEETCGQAQRTGRQSAKGVGKDGKKKLQKKLARRKRRVLGFPQRELTESMSFCVSLGSSAWL